MRQMKALMAHQLALTTVAARIPADTNVRQREDLRWQEQLPALKFHRACWLASETQRWQQVRDSLVSEFQSRVSSAVSNSIPCDAEHSMTQDPSAYTITIATLHGHVEVLAPVFVCSTCKEGVTLHPVSLG